MYNALGESVHDEAPTFKFHYPYFLSDILSVLYMLSCAEYLPWAPAVALIPLKQKHHGDRTAAPSDWGHRPGRSELFIYRFALPRAVRLSAQHAGSQNDPESRPYVGWTTIPDDAL